MADKKYYWLKLHKDFFKKHEIRVIESMENGKDYILFYLKLLLESVSHEGRLRFSELIPYNDSMLASITNTNIDVVRSAMKIFQELNMIDILDDETIYMSEVQEMIGSCTSDEGYRENHRLRQQRYRERQKQLGVTQSNVTVTQNGDVEIRDKSIEIRDKNISKDIYKGEKSKRFIPPTVEEVKAYVAEKGYHVDAENFIDFYESKGWYVGKNKMKDWKRALNTWERRDKESGRPQRSNIICNEEYRESIRNSPYQI